MNPGNRKRTLSEESNSSGDVSNTNGPNRKTSRSSPDESFGDTSNTNRPNRKTSRSSPNEVAERIPRARKKRNHSLNSSSFVSTVKEKMTNLLPTLISKWFNTPSNANGSVPLADATDSSTDDEREPEPPAISSPPRKRRKYSSVMPTDLFGDASCTNFKKRKINDDDVKISDDDYNWLLPVSRGESSASFNRTWLPRSSDDKVLVRREQVYTSDKRIKNDDKPANFTLPNKTIVDPKQPSFKPALLGSLFYPGRTSYGGSASQYIDQPNIRERKETRVNQSTDSDSLNISYSSRKVMELIEQYSSPIKDALRISYYGRSPKTETTNTSLPSPSSYKTRELHVPSILSKLRLRKTRLSKVTNTARQIMASQSSTNDSIVSLAQRERSNSPDTPTRVNKSPTSLKDYTFSVPEKETFSPLSASSPPSFKFVSPGLPCGKDNAHNNKQNADCISNITKDTNIAMPKDGQYQDVSANIKPTPSECDSCGARKLSSPEDKNLLCSVCKQPNRQSHIDKCKSCENIKTSFSYPSKPALFNNLKSTTWKCNDCWVDNEESAEKCVCCGAKCPKAKATQKPETDWTCTECFVKNNNVEKCVACGSPKHGLAKNNESISSMKPLAYIIPVESNTFKTLIEKQSEKWECRVCMIRNDSDKTNCVCCEAKKPDPLKKCIEQQSEKWDCGVCMISNNTNNAKCARCKAKRPCALKKLVEKQSEKWECGICMVHNDNNRMKCVCCEADRPGAVKKLVEKQSEKWECGICMVRNDNNRMKCVCCEAERPGAGNQIKSTFNFGMNTTNTFKFGIDANTQNINKDDVSEVTVKDLEKKNMQQEYEKNNNILPNSFQFGMPSKIPNDQTDNSSGNKKNEIPKVMFSFGIPKESAETKSVEKSDDGDKEKPQVVPKVTLPVPNMFSLTSEAIPEKAILLSEAKTKDQNENATNIQSTTLTNETISQQKPFSFSEAGTEATNLFANPSEIFSKNDSTTISNFSLQTPAATNTATPPSITTDSPVFSLSVGPPLVSSTPSIGCAAPSLGSGVSSLGSTASTIGSAVPSLGSTAPSMGSVASPLGSFVPSLDHSVSPLGSAVPAFGSTLPALGSAALSLESAKPLGSAAPSPRSAAPSHGSSVTPLSASAPLSSAALNSTALPEPKISFNFGNKSSKCDSNTFTFKFGSTSDNSGTKVFNISSDTNIGTNRLTSNIQGSGNVLSTTNNLPGNGLTDGNLHSTTEMSHNTLSQRTDLGTSNIFGGAVQKENVWSQSPFNNNTQNVFGNNNASNNLPKPVFAFGSSSNTSFNNPAPVFGSNAQPAPSIFGSPNQNAPAPQSSLFSIPGQNQPTANMFGSSQTTGNQEVPLGMFGSSNMNTGASFGVPTQTFEAGSLPQPTGSAFNFGAPQSIGVFGFGQQQQMQPQQMQSPQMQPALQAQQYNFGAQAVGSPVVQFNMGSVGARRVRKAVRRNPR